MQKTAAGASCNRKRACCGMSSYSEIIRQSRTNDRPAFTLKKWLLKSDGKETKDFYSRNPLISLMRDKIVLQLQLIMPGSVSMTLCRNCSISSPDEATACT